MISSEKVISFHEMCIFNLWYFSDNNKGSSKDTESEDKKKKYDGLPVIIEPDPMNHVNDELGILIHSHPGSICNINEIIEDMNQDKNCIFRVRESIKK